MDDPKFCSAMSSRGEVGVEIINNTLIVKGEKDIEHKDKDGKNIKHSKESFYRSTTCLMLDKYNPKDYIP